MTEKLLAKAVELPPIGGEEGFGPWGDVASKGESVGFAGSAFTFIISNVIGIMTIIAGIWFIFSFIIGAFGYLTAGGDKGKMEEAGKKLTQAVVGLVIVVSAYALMSLLGSILGFSFLNLYPLIEKLSPNPGI